MHTVQGGSTITQQLCKNLFLTPDRSVHRKLQEMILAGRVERVMSKDEILQLYLNKVPYGGNIQGVKSASILYFGKNPDHLSLAEITALSVIPNRPSTLVMGRNNDGIVQERNKWLRR